MLKEFFQSFAWYVRDIYDELIFIIVVIMCFHMETIVRKYFCNSIGYGLNWDIGVYPQLLIGHP